MATITVRKLDDAVKAGLERRAKANNRSLEAEVRAILRGAVEPNVENGATLVQGIREAVERFGGFDLEIPARTSHAERPLPDFSGPEFDTRDR